MGNSKGVFTAFDSQKTSQVFFLKVNHSRAIKVLIWFYAKHTDKLGAISCEHLRFHLWTHLCQLFSPPSPALDVVRRLLLEACI